MLKEFKKELENIVARCVVFRSNLEPLIIKAVRFSFKTILVI